MMSIRYCAAEMLLTETGWLPWGENPYTEEKIGDPRLQELIDKTEVVVREQKIHYQVDVEIRLKDGRCISAQVDYPRGHPQNPMTRMEIQQKFRNLATHRINEEKVEEIIKTVEKLDELEDLSALAKLLRL